MGRNRSPGARREGQRVFWRARYTEDPSFFGETESAFARWCLPILEREKAVSKLVELGGGYGRDARFFAGKGYRLRCVDLVGKSAQAGNSAPSRLPRIDFVEADSLGFLQTLAPGSIDAVYSNMFFNMDFTLAEHRELFRSVGRALRPRGLHLYSTRSTTDPWYGRGIRVGPDTYDLAPDGTTMHFFSREYADRLSEPAFEPVARIDTSEGEGEFPIRLLYVVDRKRS